MDLNENRKHDVINIVTLSSRLKNSLCILFKRQSESDMCSSVCRPVRISAERILRSLCSLFMMRWKVCVRKLSWPVLSYFAESY